MSENSLPFMSQAKVPKIFIASPLFNPEQIKVIESIEKLCEEHSYSYYSARRDSEMLVPKGEAKKDRNAWTPVFQNNIDGLNECDLMIAVVEYAMPENSCLTVCSTTTTLMGEVKVHQREVELADNGTVYEMGYFRGQDKIVVGYHSQKNDANLNLMLTHGCDGFISGYTNLQKFFEKPFGPAQDYKEWMYRYPEGLRHRLSVMPRYQNIVASLFNWQACNMNAVQKETV